MTFSGDLKLFAEKVNRRTKDIFVGSATGVKRSVQEGWDVTGSPGQPVDTGNLRSSWDGGFRFTSGWTAEVLTGVGYAEAIEEGMSWYGPMKLRSEVGGFHSVKLTRAGWQNIVDHVVEEVVRD